MSDPSVCALRAVWCGWLVAAIAIAAGCSGGLTPAAGSDGAAQDGGTDPSADGAGPGADLAGTPGADLAGVPAPSALVAWDEGATYTSTRYVSPSGDDGAGAGTQGSPYRTLARALQGAGPGLRVVMLAGTYPAQGSFASLQGTQANPIAIVGEGTVTIDAAAGPTGLSLSDPRYVVLENFAISGSPVHGINIDDGGSYATPADYVLLRQIRISNIGSGGNNDCLKMSGVDHFYITGSEFSGCNIGEAIDMVGCHDGTITGNYFHDTPGTGVQTKGGSRNVLIHGNRFRNVTNHSINLGGSTGTAYVRPAGAPYEGERIVVLGNVIVDSGQAAAAFIACNECVVAHNTIVGSGHWLVRILQGGDGVPIVSRMGHVIDNIFFYRRADLSVLVNVGVNTEPATFAFGNNLYFATDGTAFNGVHGSGIPDEVDGVLQQNPGFADAASGDYHVGLASPAAGQGRALPFGIVALHFDGQSPAAPPDVGAFRAGP